MLNCCSFREDPYEKIKMLLKFSSPFPAGKDKENWNNYFPGFIFPFLFSPALCSQRVLQNSTGTTILAQFFMNLVWKLWNDFCIVSLFSDEFPDRLDKIIRKWKFRRYSKSQSKMGFLYFSLLLGITWKNSYETNILFIL